MEQITIKVNCITIFFLIILISLAITAMMSIVPLIVYLLRFVTSTWSLIAFGQDVIQE